MSTSVRNLVNNTRAKLAEDKANREAKAKNEAVKRASFWTGFVIGGVTCSFVLVKLANKMNKKEDEK